MSLRTAWNRVRKALGRGGSAPEPPPPPPDEEPALVGAGSPRRPSPSTAAALEIPEDDAFRRLQKTARERNLRLADVARRIVENKSLLDPLSKPQARATKQ